jgi:hypothetical protein
MYSLGQVARAVGKAKSTISRNVKSGKVSAVRNTDGSVSIDPAELHRVYPAMPATGSKNGQWNDSRCGHPAALKPLIPNIHPHNRRSIWETRPYTAGCSETPPPAWTLTGHRGKPGWHSRAVFEAPALISLGGQILKVTIKSRRVAVLSLAVS